MNGGPTSLADSLAGSELSDETPPATPSAAPPPTGRRVMLALLLLVSAFVLALTRPPIQARALGLVARLGPGELRERALTRLEGLGAAAVPTMMSLILDETDRPEPTATVEDFIERVNASETHGRLVKLVIQDEEAFQVVLKAFREGAPLECCIGVIRIDLSWREAHWRLPAPTPDSGTRHKQIKVAFATRLVTRHPGELETAILIEAQLWFGPDENWERWLSPEHYDLFGTNYEESWEKNQDWLRSQAVLLSGSGPYIPKPIVLPPVGKPDPTERRLPWEEFKATIKAKVGDGLHLSPDLAAGSTVTGTIPDPQSPVREFFLIAGTEARWDGEGSVEGGFRLGRFRGFNAVSSLRECRLFIQSYREAMIELQDQARHHVTEVDR